MELITKERLTRSQVKNLEDVENRYNAYFDEMFIDCYKLDNNNIIQISAFYNTKKSDEIIITIAEFLPSGKMIMVEEFWTALVNQDLGIYGNTKILDIYKEQIDSIITSVIKNEEELWNDMIKEQENKWN